MQNAVQQSAALHILGQARIFFRKWQNKAEIELKVGKKRQKCIRTYKNREIFYHL